MQWVTLPPIATSVKNRKVNRHGEGSPLKEREVAVINIRRQICLLSLFYLETARDK